MSSLRKNKTETNEPQQAYTTPQPARPPNAATISRLSAGSGVPDGATAHQKPLADTSAATRHKKRTEALKHCMPNQSRLHSLLETLSSIAIGAVHHCRGAASLRHACDVVLAVDMETGEIR